MLAVSRQSSLGAAHGFSEYGYPFWGLPLIRMIVFWGYPYFGEMHGNKHLAAKQHVGAFPPKPAATDPGGLTLLAVAVEESGGSHRCSYVFFVIQLKN